MFKRKEKVEPQAPTAPQVKWEPQPLPSVQGSSPLSELSSLAKRDAWSGNRDGDRRA